MLPSTFRPLLSLSLVALACAASAGSSGPPADDDMGCVPGETQMCACTDGAAGAQVCDDAGDGWEPCVCAEGDGDVGDGDGDVGDGDGDDGDGDGGDAILCSDTCAYAFDGMCDDGGEGAAFDVCDFGSDCGDCGERQEPAGDGDGDTGSPYPDPVCGNGAWERLEDCEGQIWCTDACTVIGDEREINDATNYATDLAPYFSADGSFAIPLDSVRHAIVRDVDDGGPTPIHHLNDEDYFETDLLCPAGTLSARIDYERERAPLRLSIIRHEQSSGYGNPLGLETVDASDNLFTDYQQVSATPPPLERTHYVVVKMRDGNVGDSRGNTYVLTGQITGCPDTFPDS